MLELLSFWITQVSAFLHSFVWIRKGRQLRPWKGNPGEAAHFCTHCSWDARTIGRLQVLGWPELHSELQPSQDCRETVSQRAKLGKGQRSVNFSGRTRQTDSYSNLPKVSFESLIENCCPEAWSTSQRRALWTNTCLRFHRIFVKDAPFPAVYISLLTPISKPQQRCPASGERDLNPGEGWFATLHRTYSSH